MRRLCIVSIVITGITGQRRQFIQDLITRLKTSPRRQSISPSWSSDRQFDVIGTGPLPLQNHNLENNFETDLLETQYIPTLAPTSGQSRYESDSSSSRPLPGQFSRNRLSNSDRTYFQTQTQSGQFYQQQDPEMFDTWSTSWPQYPSSDSRRRSKRSPYKRIKLKIGNPFYYPGSRRRVRVKKVISADPVYHRETSRSYHQHEVGAGYHRLWNDDNHYDDDQLQQLTIVDVNDFNRETESLQNDDDQEVSKFFNNENDDNKFSIIVVSFIWWSKGTARLGQFHHRKGRNILWWWCP